jgi:twitching motility protein PilT
MSLVPSLLQAIVRVDGDALVMHAGDKPYVVSPTGQVDLANRGLTLDAVNGVVNQLLPIALQQTLQEFGAVQYELPPMPEFPGEHFTVVAARGGDDLWTEIRRRRVADDDRIPEEFFESASPAPAVAHGPAANAAVPLVAVAQPPSPPAGSQAAAPQAEWQARPLPPVAPQQTPSESLELPGAKVDDDLDLPNAAQLWPERRHADDAESEEGEEIELDLDADVEAEEEDVPADAPPVDAPPPMVAVATAPPVAIALPTVAAAVAPPVEVPLPTVAVASPVDEPLPTVAVAVAPPVDEPLPTVAVAVAPPVDEPLPIVAVAVAPPVDLPLPTIAVAVAPPIDVPPMIVVAVEPPIEACLPPAAMAPPIESPVVEDAAAAAQAVGDQTAAPQAPLQRILRAMQRSGVTASAALRSDGPTPDGAAPPGVDIEPTPPADASMATASVQPPDMPAHDVMAVAPTLSIEEPAPLHAPIAAILQPLDERTLAVIAAAPLIIPEALPASVAVVEATPLAAVAVPEVTKAPPLDLPTVDVVIATPSIAEQPPVQLAAEPTAPFIDAHGGRTTEASPFDLPSFEVVAAPPATPKLPPSVTVPTAQATEASPFDIDTFDVVPPASPIVAKQPPAPIAATRTMPSVTAPAAKVPKRSPLDESTPTVVAAAPPVTSKPLPPPSVNTTVSVTAPAAKVAKELPLDQPTSIIVSAVPAIATEQPPAVPPRVAFTAPPRSAAPMPQRTGASAAPFAASPEDAAAAARTASPSHAVVLPIFRTPVRSEPPSRPVSDLTLSSLERLLRVSSSRGASTLYLSSGSRPSVRVDGELQILDGEPVYVSRDVESLLLTLMPERSHEALRSGAATEWIADIEGVGRVRCMSFRDHRGPGGVFRLIPTASISADQLGLSRQVQSLAIEPEGLVLVAGPRSSGKRTLMAAFVELMSRKRRDHIITIEREVNIVHDRGQSFISQREVRGNDDEMLAAARAALREDPDVLMIEDLRAGPLMNVALEAAASGRLVVGGFSAHTATGAIDRIIDLYAPEYRRQVQLALADSLRGVIVQTLVRKIGGGRLPAREVLLVTPAVSSVIAEGQTSQLPMMIEGGQRYGMMPMNDTLVGLVQNGSVDVDEAYRRSPDRPGFLAALNRQGLDTSFVERLA